MAYSSEVIERVWSLTRPKEKVKAEEYHRHLVTVLETPEEQWHLLYQHPFDVPKKSGGARQIIPAGNDLRYVQAVVAQWIIKSLPLANDYCYIGAGVLSAVLPHKGAVAGYVCDLKSAFEHVTRKRVENEFRLHASIVPEDLVMPITDLLVLGDRARQGCVSTPYVYDFVVRPLERHLALIAKRFKVAFTLYVDNMCFSTADPEADLHQLQTTVRHTVDGFGWELSVDRIDTEAIRFLGMSIGRGYFNLDPDKYGEIYDAILQALQDPQPLLHRNRIGGLLSWAHQVYGDMLPNDLLDLFSRYYALIGRPQLMLRELSARRQTKRLFY